MGIKPNQTWELSVHGCQPRTDKYHVWLGLIPKLSWTVYKQNSYIQVCYSQFLSNKSCYQPFPINFTLNEHQIHSLGSFNSDFKLFASYMSYSYLHTHTCPTATHTLIYVLQLPTAARTTRYIPVVSSQLYLYQMNLHRRASVLSQMETKMDSYWLPINI